MHTSESALTTLALNGQMYVTGSSLITETAFLAFLAFLAFHFNFNVAEPCRSFYPRLFPNGILFSSRRAAGQRVISILSWAHDPGRLPLNQCSAFFDNLNDVSIGFSAHTCDCF